MRFAVLSAVVVGLAASVEASVKCSISATSGNVVAGDLCDLPFFYNGIRHDQATTEYNGVASCPTVTAWDKSADSSYWGPASCFDATCVTSYTEHSGGSAMPAGIACSFPFVFNGVTYYSCAKNQYKDTGSDIVGWCAVGADSSGEGWGWAQWGDCDCTGTGNPVPPPAPPSPSPPAPSPPGPPSPSPPSPPSPHPPSPSPGPPGKGGQTGDSDVDSVAVTFGTISVLVFAAVCVVVVYRRRRRLASDMGDLAPWGFEKQALLRSGGGGSSGSQSSRQQSTGYEKSNASFAGLDMSSSSQPHGSQHASQHGGGMGGLGMFQPPSMGGSMGTSPAGKYPGPPGMSPSMSGGGSMHSGSMHGGSHAGHSGFLEPSMGGMGGPGGSSMGMGPPQGIAPLSSPHSNQSQQGLSQHAPPMGAMTPGSQTSHSTHYSDYMHQDDWIQTEAAAAKMRSCFIKKSPGDRIGLRLLNFMGRNTRGVCVVGVKPDTAGAQAGIEEGDMIVEIDCRSVLNLTHEQVLDMLVNAGDAYSIIVSRG